MLISGGTHRRKDRKQCSFARARRCARSRDGVASGDDDKEGSWVPVLRDAQDMGVPATPGPAPDPARPSRLQAGKCREIGTDHTLPPTILSRHLIISQLG